jgi:hypothetical protein
MRGAKGPCSRFKLLPNTILWFKRQIVSLHFHFEGGVLTFRRLSINLPPHPVAQGTREESSSSGVGLVREAVYYAAAVRLAPVALDLSYSRMNLT